MGDDPAGRSGREADVTLVLASVMRDRDRYRDAAVAYQYRVEFLLGVICVLLAERGQLSLLAETESTIAS